jgi:hypothetical protein
MGAIDRNYESDFYAWANEQAALLREGRLLEADIEHIALEIESMGKTEKRELVARLTILLLHLLKWKFQPNLRGRSWRLSIREQRKEVINHLADNPSLKSKIEDLMAQAYDLATVKAARETAIDEDGFPSACPWTFEEAISEGFWPE